MTMNKTDLLRLYVLLSVLLQLITENVPFGLLKKKSVFTYIAYMRYFSCNRNSKVLILIYHFIEIDRYTQQYFITFFFQNKFSLKKYTLVHKSKMYNLQTKRNKM